MAKIKNRVGDHYGHWVVVAQDIEKTNETGKIYWDCECDCGCGTHKSIRTDALYQVKVGGCNNMVSSKPKTCAKCKKIFYPKKQAKTRQYCYDCVPEANYSSTLIRAKIKDWALEYKGNKCSCCGYNKCKEALEFHHINPEEKDFIISDRHISFTWDEAKKELDKCIVVCSNCHREIHAGIRKIEESNL